MKEITRYAKIWWILTIGTTQIAFASRFGAAIFMIGKLLRFAFFLLFLVVLISKTHSLASYSFWQVIFFYATFNLVDTLPQFFLRDVYRFRYQVVSGYFDYILTKPFSPLFKALFGGCDVLDFSMLLVSAGFIGIAGSHIGVVTIGNAALYILLIVNAFLIALAFHVVVLSMGILTTEVDNTIMLYRDMTQIGRFPIEIYKEPLRGLLTFIIPVGIMMAFPAKAMLGLLSVQLIILSFVVGFLLLFGSYLFWQYSLRHYSSASS